MQYSQGREWLVRALSRRLDCYLICVVSLIWSAVTCHRFCPRRLGAAWLVMTVFANLLRQVAATKRRQVGALQIRALPKFAMGYKQRLRVVPTASSTNPLLTIRLPLESAENVHENCCLLFKQRRPPCGCCVQTVICLSGHHRAFEFRQRLPAGRANVNSNVVSNANISNVNVNANLSSAPTSAIPTREPERYRATLVFSAETEGGQKTVGIPSLSAEVARNGADRRVSFKLPDGSDLIYLEQGDKHIVITPARKQYAELTPEATGFQLQKLMTPGQLVSYLGRLKGVERVGEEPMAGRTAEKYRYSNTTETSTAAGQVKTEAFVFVDKETGLPLRAELFTEASGNVQGVKGAKVVAEMRDISTTVDDTLFQVPPGLNKFHPNKSVSRSTRSPALLRR